MIHIGIEAVARDGCGRTVDIKIGHGNCWGWGFSRIFWVRHGLQKEDPRDSRHNAGVKILGTTHNKSNAGHKGAEMVSQACPKDSWGTALMLKEALSVIDAAMLNNQPIVEVERKEDVRRLGN